MATTKNTGHKIGIYIRVSTEEQAENPEGSIRNQEERLRSAVKLKNLDGHFGEIVNVFIDRAKSGKDTNRPELKRLLQAIEKREVNLVMVTDLSRLSRSIKDFSDMWELMKARGCGFQSLRECFDTTTAAGEMVLYTMANLAQFERKQVAERVTANIQARAARGLYNGGVLPLGYKLIPEKKGHLDIDTDQAELVRTAFRTMVTEGSLSQTAKKLNAMGLTMNRHKQGGGGKPRLGHFSVPNLHDILKNKAYIGVRTFNIKGELKEAKALWEPLVDPELFDRVQAILKANYRRYKPVNEKKFPYLLSNLVFCSQCGGRLCGKSANGNSGKVPYYEHGWLTKRNGCLVKQAFDCKPFRVLAKRLEPIVWDAVERLLEEPKRAKELIQDAKISMNLNSKSETLRKAHVRLEEISSQLDTLAERLGTLPKNLSPAPVYKQMEKLERLKKEQAERIVDLNHETEGSRMPAQLSTFEALLAALKTLRDQPESVLTRAKIVHALVEKVELTPTSARVHFRVGEEDLQWELTKAGSVTRKSPGMPTQSFTGRDNMVRALLTNGGLTWNRTTN